MLKYYAGIGSRETPIAVLCTMTDIAVRMASLGLILRSGAAPGADTAFEAGANRRLTEKAPEIYLPWKGFNGHPSPLLWTKEAMILAEKYHPAWNKCSPAARKMHARNCHQVLGHDLKTPSQFIICWTKDAKGGGGTGQAIRVANAFNIPVYDLADPETLRKFKGD